MTGNELAFLFNSQISGFFLEKDVLVYREKRHGKKWFGINDLNSYTEEETKNDFNVHPVCEFRTLDELLEYEYKGKKIKDWLSPLSELNIDNSF